MPAGAASANLTVQNGGVPYISGQLPHGLQDVLLILVIFAFFSCGSAVQGAGSRLAFSYARDGAAWIEVDLGSQRAVQDPGQRPVRRRADHGGVYFAVHGGRKIGAHLVDTDAPGYLPLAPGPAPVDAGSTADAQGAGSHRPEAP